MKNSSLKNKKNISMLLIIIFLLVNTVNNGNIKSDLIDDEGEINNEERVDVIVKNNNKENIYSNISNTNYDSNDSIINSEFNFKQKISEDIDNLIIPSNYDSDKLTNQNKNNLINNSNIISKNNNNNNEEFTLHSNPSIKKQDYITPLHSNSNNSKDQEQNKSILSRLFNFSFSEKEKALISNSSEPVQGSIIINGEKYIAVCDCSDKATKSSSSSASSTSRSEVSAGSCDPSKIKITTEMTGSGANIDQIKTLIGNVEDLEFVKVDNLSLFCLDGRNRKTGVSTPGGDAGEFLLALDVYENLLPNNKKLDYNVIELLFKSYLKYMKPESFNMCSDDVSLEFIKNEMMVSE